MDGTRENRAKTLGLMGGISTAVNAVRKFGDDPDVRSKSLDLIERGLWSIRDVVDSVLACHRMPPDSRGLTPSDMDDLRALIEPEVRRQSLQLSWRSAVSTTVNVAATETRQIALNLLLNACAASPPDEEVRFAVWVDRGSTLVAPATLRMEIGDSGPGLPPAIAAALTEFGPVDPQGSPYGLGVRVVRDLVRGLGGRILAMRGANGQGTRIVGSGAKRQHGTRVWNALCYLYVPSTTLQIAGAARLRTPRRRSPNCPLRMRCINSIPAIVIAA